MHHQNLEKLKRLKLFGMARALEDLQRLADRGQLDFADQLALLIDREASDRANTALHTRLNRLACARPPASRTSTSKPARGLDKSTIRDLFTCRWIGEHRHLIVTGKPAQEKLARCAWAIRPPVRATACCTRACRGCLTTLLSPGSAMAWAA